MSSPGPADCTLIFCGDSVGAVIERERERAMVIRYDKISVIRSHCHTRRFTFLLSLRYDGFRRSARVDGVYSIYSEAISEGRMKPTD